MERTGKWTGTQFIQALVWTDPDNIKRVNIHFMNGDDLEVKVEVIVRNSEGHYLFLVYLDNLDNEVIVPWTAIRDLTILERH